MTCQFPGLNSIENVWGLMKIAMEKRRPNNLVDLKEIIQEIWDNLPQTYIVDLFCFMPSLIDHCTCGRCHEILINISLNNNIKIFFHLNLNTCFGVQNRKVCHSKVTLSNIDLIFLPPNTTSLYQPLDLEIIRNFKLIYQKRVLKILLDHFERVG